MSSSRDTELKELLTCFPKERRTSTELSNTLRNCLPEKSVALSHAEIRRIAELRIPAFYCSNEFRDQLSAHVLFYPLQAISPMMIYSHPMSAPPFDPALVGCCAELPCPHDSATRNRRWREEVRKEARRILGRPYERLDNVAPRSHDGVALTDEHKSALLILEEETDEEWTDEEDDEQPQDNNDHYSEEEPSDNEASGLPPHDRQTFPAPSQEDHTGLTTDEDFDDEASRLSEMDGQAFSAPSQEEHTGWTTEEELDHDEEDIPLSNYIQCQPAKASRKYTRRTTSHKKGAYDADVIRREMPDGSVRFVCRHCGKDFGAKQNFLRHNKHQHYGITRSDYKPDRRRRRPNPEQALLPFSVPLSLPSLPIPLSPPINFE